MRVATAVIASAMLVLGCTTRAAPVVDRQLTATRVSAPSSFAARAPAHTRVLLSFGSGAAPLVSDLEEVASYFPHCTLPPKAAALRVEVAIAEPAELRIDVSGKISKAALECMLDALVESGMVDAHWLQVAALGNGVRIATRAALADGPGGAPALTRRFEELRAQSEYVFVSDTAPGGRLYQGVGLPNDDFEALLELSSAAKAGAAARWLTRAVSESANPALAKVSVRADKSALVVRFADAGAELALALKREVIEAFRTPSASMHPTLIAGDHVFALKAPADGPPERGALVVFESPSQPSQVFIKRVIGVPGDRVQLDGYILRVNGVALDTALVAANVVAPDTAEPSAQLWSEVLGAHRYQVTRIPSQSATDTHDVTVPADSVFLLGDNRDASADSRQFGSVPLANVKGRVVLIWASFSQNGVRWERFGLEPD